MADIIEIRVAVEEIETRRERIESVRRFEEPDRVPVLPAIAHRFFIPRIGTKFRDYYDDPETMLQTQILAQKWLLENIHTDGYSITGPWVGAGWVKNEADLRRLEAMDFIHSGLNARQIIYRKTMVEIAEKYPVRFKGGPMFYPGAQASLTRTCDGPFGVAGDLMGKTDIFLAVAERPDFVRELMRIVTAKLIAYLDFCWEEEKLPGPRDFAWTDDLDIDEYQGFGYEVDLERIAKIMGGKVVLLGNVNPMLIRSGTPAQVREATRRVIETLAPLKGFIVQDGNNIPPGSPIENINAMMEAAEMYGRYR
ncbi:MAG: uroporphyrinogen decarboxylase family protein [Candidatus Aminicenantales bacterium]